AAACAERPDASRRGLVPADAFLAAPPADPLGIRGHMRRKGPPVRLAAHRAVTVAHPVAGRAHLERDVPAETAPAYRHASSVLVTAGSAPPAGRWGGSATGWVQPPGYRRARSEEHTSELQSRGHLVCRLLL